MGADRSDSRRLTIASHETQGSESESEEEDEKKFDSNFTFNVVFAINFLRALCLHSLLASTVPYQGVL